MQLQQFVRLWSLFRISAVFLLWWHPVYGFLINIGLDAVDGDIIERLGGSRKKYQHWDKLMDIWLYVWIIVFAYLHMPPSNARLFLQFAFLWRALGFAFYITFKHEWLFFFFPSFIAELFGLWLLAPSLLEFYPAQSLIILMALVLYKEWWIHVKHSDLTNMISGRKKRWR